MTIYISEQHKTDRAEGTRVSLDRGVAHAKIQLYSGVQPSAGGTPTTLLGEIVLSKPCGTTADGQLTLTQQNTYDLALNNGTATWARFIDGDGNWCIDCDVSDTSGTSPVKLDNIVLFAGGQIALAAAVLG